MVSKPLDFGIRLSLDHGKYFSFVDRCFDASNHLINRLESERDFSDKPTFFQKTMYPNLIKSQECICSLAKLTDAGLSGDAVSISRKLFEQWINIEYIALYGEEGLKKYWYYSLIRTYAELSSKINNTLTSDINRNVYVNQRKDIQEPYEKSKTLFELDCKGEPAKRYQYHWAGKTLCDMALDCKLDEDYKTYYPSLSSETHGSMESCTRFIRMSESGFIVESSPQPFDALSNLLYGCRFLIGTLAAIARLGSTEIDERIELLSGEAIELGNSVILLQAD